MEEYNRPSTMPKIGCIFSPLGDKASIPVVPGRATSKDRRDHFELFV